MENMLKIHKMPKAIDRHHGIHIFATPNHWFNCGL